MNARKLWFDSCTDYINTVITNINIIRQLSQINSNVSNYFDVIVDSLSFRSIVGNESSIITSAIAANSKLSYEDDAEFIFLRGEEKQVWSEIEKDIMMLDSENLTLAFENVREQFYLRFRPEQERIIQLALNNQLYEGADKEIANLSVPALDSISHLSDEAVKGIKIEKEVIVTRQLLMLLFATTKSSECCTNLLGNFDKLFYFHDEECNVIPKFMAFNKTKYVIGNAVR